jgi:hypothetical protein
MYSLNSNMLFVSSVLLLNKRISIIDNLSVFIKSIVALFDSLINEKAT